PTPEAAENFKDPAWNVEGNPWDQAITKATEFKASATSSTFDKANITGIEVTKDPTTMTYTEGDKPKHDGIKVKLTDKNGNTVEVEKDKLADYGVTVTPAEDKGLTVKDNNGKPFVAKVNGKDAGGQAKELTANGKTNITVNPKNSDKDVIPFEPSDPTKPADKDDPNIPTTDDKNNPINREDYVVIGFKVSPDNSGSLTLGEQKDKAVISALVKKDSEWAKVTLPITNDGNDYTFWHWDNAPADKVAEGQVRIASFIKSGDEISPNETNPLPKDFHKVTVAKGTGVANNDLFGKTYAVKKDDTLAQDKFPTLEVSDATKYKDPAWNVTDPWTVPVADTDVTYTASATSTAFDASNVTDMTVKTQPKLDYVEGSADNGKLNLSSLVVTLTDKNGNTQDVPFAKLDDYGITADPANGTDLTVDANNGKPVTLTKGNLTATTENLQVTKPADKPTITNPAAKNEPGKDSTTVTGKTTPKTEVTVKDKDGKEIGKGNSDEDGNFSIDTNPKQNPGTEVTVTPKDGTPAKATVTEESAPAKPTIDQPYVGDKTISGTGEPDEMLVVTDKDDNLIAEIRVGKNGKWSVDVPTNKPLKKGDEITATQDGVSVTATVKAKTSSGGSSGGGSVIPSKPEPKPEKPSEGDLNKADHYQYLVGYPDGTFAPNRGMTRAEVATMFTRLLKDRPVKGKAYKVALSDVHAGDWYADTVGYAVEKGIVSGYPDGSFKPNQAITRAEFASIASRFAELTESKDLSFSDLDASYWGYKAIRLAASNGWISGYPDNTFRPEQAITRAEVTSITNRMLNRSADLDWINAHSAKVIHFSDVSAGDWFFEPVMEATMGHDFTREKDGKAEKWTGLNDKTFI
ncbi:S-layer homology domain-containing protein, partial [Peptococcus niger]